MTYPTEDSLFGRIQRDEREALNLLFDLYFEPICHFVNSFVKNASLSEEIVSDVFFNLWVKRKTLKITGNIKAYLYKAARNQAVSYMRKPSFTHETLELELEADNYTQPDHLLIQKESLNHWQKMIDRLPDRCRMVFTLHREENFTYKQIAELLEISEKTVENQMGKALKLLRESLTQLKKG